VLRPDDLREETLVVFPRAANPALHDRLLDLLESAGYRFRAVREAGGASSRDLVLSIAQGAGVGLEPVSQEELSRAGAIVVRRSLDPPVRMPGAVVAWRPNPPRRLREVLDAVREIARKLARDDSS